MRIRTAFARQLLDARTVGDHQTRSAVIDQILLAQTLRNARHARAMHPENASDVFMRQSESVSSAPALKRQQPRAESLLNRMKRIAHHPLRKLFDLGIDVVMKCHLQTRIRDHFSFENVSTDDKRGSRNADLHAVCRPAGVEC
jgi:hypothetical protein